MIEKDLMKEMLKCIDITKQTARNNIETTLDCYTELVSRLEMLSYLLISTEKNSFKG